MSATSVPRDDRPRKPWLACLRAAAVNRGLNDDIDIHKASWLCTKPNECYCDDLSRTRGCLAGYLEQSLFQL
jgi:hypothetical protein